MALPTSGTATGTTASSAHAARLLVDAEAFLRLGLVDKAISHLASALQRDPDLRALREPLVKLYIARRRNKSAISELWALLSTCESPQEEIRYLRYIVRLGDKDENAQGRLQTVISQQPLSSKEPSEDILVPEAVVSKLGGELRDYLRKNQPSSDLMQTQSIPESDRQQYLDEQNALGATTSPNSARVEELAEEMALSSGTLHAELEEVEACLQLGRYDAARGLLTRLRERYPHSKNVEHKLQQLSRLERAHPAQRAAYGAVPAPAASVAPPARATSARAAAAGSTAPERTRDSARTRGARGSDGQAPEIGGTTLEVDPGDIREERSAPKTERSSAKRLPPPPPSPSSLALGAESVSARAYQMATTMRAAGEHEQAIAMLNKITGDAKYAVRATLMIGLSLRDLDQLDAAARMFLQAVNLPQAAEAELSELFYELGATYQLLGNSAEAIMFFQLSQGGSGSFRDSDARIAALQDAVLRL